MKNILLIVDVQDGFTYHPHCMRVANKIQQLLDDKIFDCTIATRFKNQDDSMFERCFGWRNMKTTEEQRLSINIEESVDAIFDKIGYTCTNNDFLRWLISIKEDGNLPEVIYICGMDTDCSILKIATDFFEMRIRPIVLADYCTSVAGIDAHTNGLKCLNRLIGPAQIHYGRIGHSEVLKRI